MTAGGQSPRPAPIPPMAGASRPPGRALAFVVLGATVPVGPWPQTGRGNAMRFLIRPERQRPFKRAADAECSAPHFR